MAVAKGPMTVVRRAAIAPPGQSGPTANSAAQARPSALDAIDFTIIRILQEDGRAAFTAIAKQLGYLRRLGAQPRWTADRLQRAAHHGHGRPDGAWLRRLCHGRFEGGIGA